jgi:hypothetical protein
MVTLADQGFYTAQQLLQSGIDRGVEYHKMFNPRGTEWERVNRAKSDLESQAVQRKIAQEEIALQGAKIAQEAQMAAADRALRQQLANQQISAAMSSDRANRAHETNLEKSRREAALGDSQASRMHALEMLQREAALKSADPATRLAMEKMQLEMEMAKEANPLELSLKQQALKKVQSENELQSLLASAYASQTNPLAGGEEGGSNFGGKRVVLTESGYKVVDNTIDPWEQEQRQMKREDWQEKREEKERQRLGEAAEALERGQRAMTNLRFLYGPPEDVYEGGPDGIASKAWNVVTFGSGSNRKYNNALEAYYGGSNVLRRLDAKVANATGFENYASNVQHHLIAVGEQLGLVGLENAKAAGTAGSISNMEYTSFKNAMSQLGVRVDKDGNATLKNSAVSPATFKAELDKVTKIYTLSIIRGILGVSHGEEKGRSLTPDQYSQILDNFEGAPDDLLEVLGNVMREKRISIGSDTIRDGRSAHDQFRSIDRNRL